MLSKRGLGSFRVFIGGDSEVLGRVVFSLLLFRSDVRFFDFKLEGFF